MKKILTILASVGLTATSVATVSCQTKMVTPKKNLQDLIKQTKINGDFYNTKLTVLLRILELNSTSGVQESDVEIVDFHPANYKEIGWEKIKVKNQNKFCGQVVVTITSLTPQTLIHFLYAYLDLGFVIDESTANSMSRERLDKIYIDKDKKLKLKDYVILGKPENGKIHVYLKDGVDNLTDEVDFTYTLKKDISKLLTDKLLNLGTVEDLDQARTKAKKRLCGLGITKKVVLSNREPGKIHVEANDESLIGEADFLYKIEKTKL